VRFSELGVDLNSVLAPRTRGRILLGVFRLHENVVGNEGSIVCSIRDNFAVEFIFEAAVVDVLPET